MMNPEVDFGRIDIDGGKVGILLIHGYTGSTAEVRPLAEYLGRHGLTVVAPLLPGHGTSVEDLNRRSWREVAQAAREEFYSLQSRCETVFVGGLSMGGLLALHLGQSAAGIAGLLPMAPALYLKERMHHLLPIAKYLVPSLAKSSDIKLSVEDADSVRLLWNYDRNPLRFADEVLGLMRNVRDRLPLLDQPMLVFHGRHDRTVPVSASQVLITRCRSRDTELVILEHSGHCLSVDGEREQLGARSLRWIARVSADPALRKMLARPVAT